MAKQGRGKPLKAKQMREAFKPVASLPPVDGDFYRIADVLDDEHASLAKAYTTVKCRETVGYARELLGGNGILLENHVGRFVADAETPMKARVR